MVRTIWIAAPPSATARTGASSRNDNSSPSEKQQKRDTKLRQLFDFMDVADGQPTRERTDEDAGEDVADDQRLSDTLSQKTPARAAIKTSVTSATSSIGPCSVHTRSENAKFRKTHSAPI